jgi:beta-barrel assembly-enhancing protease
MRRLVAIVALALPLSGCAMSQQEEVALGQEYAAQINQQLPIMTDPEVNRYINVLGDSLARLTSRADLDWHFYVVNSREVNAFAVPGGFIYINRGLIERMDNLSQLAGVLGHEIGHVVRRHSVEQMQKAQGANIGVTLACVLTRICETQAAQAGIQIAGNAVFARFSRQDESEADADAVAMLVRARINPVGIPQMFQKLIEERQRRPEGVEAWFATHPVEEDRVAHTQSMIDRYNAADLRRLTTDTPNFQAFKRRVMSIPPAQ